LAEKEGYLSTLVTPHEWLDTFMGTIKQITELALTKHWLLTRAATLLEKRPILERHIPQCREDQSTTIAAAGNSDVGLVVG